MTYYDLQKSLNAVLPFYRIYLLHRAIESEEFSFQDQILIILYCKSDEFSMDIWNSRGGMIFDKVNGDMTVHRSIRLMTDAWEDAWSWVINSGVVYDGENLFLRSIQTLLA